MPLSPAEMDALREIERGFAQAELQPAVWRRPSAWIGLWLLAAALLVVGGLALGTTAAVVLGVAWAVGAVVAFWAARHLTIVPAREGSEE